LVGLELIQMDCFLVDGVFIANLRADVAKEVGTSWGGVKIEFLELDK
jgi:hypothetical protein